MIKPGIELVKSGISEILIMTEKMGNDDAIRSLGKASPHYGLPHNLLLAHPDLDTTIENNAQLDALQMVKFRAINLEGDEDGAHEMGVVRQGRDGRGDRGREGRVAGEGLGPGRELGGGREAAVDDEVRDLEMARESFFFFRK